jgi:hypothetical protein
MITEKLLLTYPDGSKFIVADEDREKLIELSPYGTTGKMVHCKEISGRWFIVDKNQPDDGFPSWDVIQAKAKEIEIEDALIGINSSIRSALAPNFKTVSQRKAEFDLMKSDENQQ